MPTTAHPPVYDNYTYSKQVSRSEITPVVNVDLATGNQIGLTSDASTFPASYDYQKVTSQNSNKDPLIIQFWKGGTYNTGTGVYTGGTLKFTHYFTYDVSNTFVSLYVLAA